MLTLTESQLWKRYTALPARLKEVVNSPSISQITQDIGVSHHLAPDKIDNIAIIAAEIVLGFRHVRDLPGAIRSELNLDNRLAVALANEINLKVFTPFISELEKNYNPVVAYEPPASPKSAEERKKDLSEVQAIVEQINQEYEALMQEINKALGEDITPLGKAAKIEPPVLIKPPFVGKTPAEIPLAVPKISETRESRPETKQPPPIEGIKRLEVKTEISPKPAMLDEIKSAVKKPTIEPIKIEPPKVQGGPAILHKEAEQKPISELAPQTQKRFLGGLFGFLSKKKTETKLPEKPIAAQIKIAPNAVQQGKGAPEEKSRLIDYPAGKPPIKIDFTASQAPKLDQQKPIQKPITEPPKTTPFAAPPATPGQTSGQFTLPKVGVPKPIEILKSIEVQEVQFDKAAPLTKPPALGIKSGVQPLEDKMPVSDFVRPPKVELPKSEPPKDKPIENIPQIPQAISPQISKQEIQILQPSQPKLNEIKPLETKPKSEGPQPAIIHQELKKSETPPSKKWSWRGLFGLASKNGKEAASKEIIKPTDKNAATKIENRQKPENNVKKIGQDIKPPTPKTINPPSNLPIE